MRRLFWIVLLFLLMAMPCLAEPVQDVIVRRVFDDYKLDTLSFEIEVLANSLTAQEAPASDITYRPLTQSEPRGLFTVLVEISRRGTVVERGQIRMRIKQFADVLVARDRISRHENLTPGQFTLQRMEITSLLEQPVQSVDRIDGSRAKRNLTRGQILTTGAIEPVPDIEVGREVSIIYTNGACTITAAGRVMETGWAGDYIRVKNTSSGKVITARVVDHDTVAVGQ